MMSYKLQYPKLLFKKEQRDYSNDTFKIENTDYLINTVNPFNWLFCARKIRDMKPDLVIFQWWHPYFAPCYWSVCKFLRNIKVLFVCHNVFPHERFTMDKLLTKMTLSKGDYFLVQSLQDETDLLSIKQNAAYRRTVLPTYNAFRFQNLTKETGRRLLTYSNSQKLLLFFGFIREYKGLKYLLKAMPAVTSRLPETKLLVVGDFAGDKADYLNLISELKIENYVDIYDGYIPDKEVEKFFAASDLVVLPYESATQSAVVQVAYGFEKPVVVTNVGGLPEVVVDGKTGYIVEPRSSHLLANRIINYFNESKAIDFCSNIQAEAYRYSWEHLVQIIDDMTR